MKVKANENLARFLTKDKEYEVIRETEEYYYIKNNTGIVGGVFKHRFDVVTDSIFKEGDKVYNHIFGWATVKGVAGNYCVLLDEKNATYGIDSGHLSFTEYTQTGFSQERPIELPEIGEVCLFSDFEVTWCISEFNGYGSLEYPFGTFDLGDFKHCKRVKFL